MSVSGSVSPLACWWFVVGLWLLVIIVVVIVVVVIVIVSMSYCVSGQELFYVTTLAFTADQEQTLASEQEPAGQIS